MYLLYLLIIIALTLIPQILINVTYNKYASIKVNANKSGEDIVRDMLNYNDINDVSIRHIGGVLTDNYNAKEKVISLSRDNYQQASIASIAVAAHETGHAIQDHKGYFFLKLRHALGPATIVASKVSWIAIYIGFLLFFTPLIWVGIVALGVIVIFDLVTLPVEINASLRAKRYLASTGEFTSEEVSGAGKVLIAAALTYVGATLAGILQLIRLLGIVNRD